MDKNKSLGLIILALVASILIAIFFQFSFVKYLYKDEEVKIENEFLINLEDTLFRYIVDTSETTINKDGFNNNFVSMVFKSHSIVEPFNNNDFKHDVAFLKESEELNLTLTNQDVENIKKSLKEEMDKYYYNLSYSLDYIPYSSNIDFDKINQSTDMLIGYPFGLFSISYINKNAHLILKIKYVIFSSFAFIVMIALSGLFLIKKYLNERKMSMYKNEFINNLTHELQTPVTISNLALEKLNTELSNNQKLIKYVSIAKHENTKIGNLVKRILKLAELKTLFLKKDTVELNACIEQFVGRYKLVLNKDDTIITEFKHRNLKLNVNKEQFIDLLDNLISNAIKHTKSPRVITIRATKQNNKLKLTIKDNGKGISKEFHDKIFEPFFKVPSEDVHEIKSHGLGLSYVQEIVKIMNGSILCTSEEQKGTEFTIILPYEI